MLQNGGGSDFVLEVCQEDGQYKVRRGLFESMVVDGGWCVVAHLTMSDEWMDEA
jgi:hypothetical protein